jgi:uncharacterized membrane protein
MSRLRTTLGMLGLGAGLMYFLDPKQGEQRRQLVREQANAMASTLTDLVSEGVDDLRYRTRSTLADTQSRFGQGASADWLLKERAQALVARYASFPQAVEVKANGGRLVVSGPILHDEAESLLGRLREMPGVQQVDDHLNRHAVAGFAPGLQGTPRRRTGPAEASDEAWSPGLRLLSTAGGGALALYGLQHGGLSGLLLGLTGAALTARGLANKPVGQLASSSGPRTVDVKQSITVNAPIERVYAFWADPANYARFMDHVKEVRRQDSGQAHWRIAGAQGQPLEWEVEATQNVPHRSVAWRSAPGQPVRNLGMAQFARLPEGGTRVTVRLSYTLPDIGEPASALFGDDPQRALEQDLKRFKTLIESEPDMMAQPAGRRPATARPTGSMN